MCFRPVSSSEIAAPYSAVKSAMFAVSAEAFRTILRSDVINIRSAYEGIVARLNVRINVQNARAFMVSASRHFAKMLTSIEKQYLNE